MLNRFFICLFLGASTWSFGQKLDTLKVMHYNLLNYRNTTNQCTESTNKAEDKDGYLEIIAAHVKPDVLTVNEMGAHWLNPNKILVNALNKNGVSHFEQAEFANNTFSSLTNMLFYNNEKLVMYGQAVIDKDQNGDDLVRVVDVYTLYYKKDAGLAQGDTIFLTFIVAHLKAGSAGDDKLQRGLMTQAVMKYLETNKVKGSYLLCGDLNIQTSNEDSYKNLTLHTNENIRFLDPVAAPGSWNNNNNYANLHTQSTHVSDTRGGCFSGGGMDDRFDFILCGKEVMDNSRNVGYINGSYLALGQDSRRFNGEINSPLNTLVPVAVANALYDMSDHLPVILQVEITKKLSSVQPFGTFSGLTTKYLSENSVLLEFKATEVEQIQIVNTQGQVIVVESDLGLLSKYAFSTSNLQPGVYVTFIKTNSAGLLINKFIVHD